MFINSANEQSKRPTSTSTPTSTSSLTSNSCGTSVTQFDLCRCQQHRLQNWKSERGRVKERERGGGDCKLFKQATSAHSTLNYDYEFFCCCLSNNHCVNIYPKGKSKFNHCLSPLTPSLPHTLSLSLSISFIVSINQVFASNICIAFVLDADIKCRILIHVRLLQIQLATCHLNNSIYSIYGRSVAAIWLSI